MTYVDPQRIAAAGGTAPKTPPPPMTTTAAWKTYRGADFDSAARAKAVLAAAEQQFRALTDQTISLVTDDVVSIYMHRRRRYIVLPEQPIVSVASFAVQGMAWTQGTDFDVDDAAGAIYVLHGNRPRMHGQIEVTYTHGYAIIPADIPPVIYAIAERLLANPTGERVTQEQLGDFRVTYDIGTATARYGLDPIHETVIDRYSNLQPLVA